MVLHSASLSIWTTYQVSTLSTGDTLAGSCDKRLTKQRQMHQFIVSMERIAAQSAWTGRNRFDSFAPLRVNVAAQWLVDGVSDFSDWSMYEELTSSGTTFGT